MTFRPPDPGELNQVCSIQQFESTGLDANGQPAGAWVQVSAEYVRLDGISGRILEIARQQFELATHMIYMRYNAAVTRSVRLAIGGVVYSVGWVDSMNDQWMRCTVEESWPDDPPPSATDAIFTEDGLSYLGMEDGLSFLKTEDAV